MLSSPLHWFEWIDIRMTGPKRIQSSSPKQSNTLCCRRTRQTLKRCGPRIKLISSQSLSFLLWTGRSSVGKLLTGIEPPWVQFSLQSSIPPGMFPRKTAGKRNGIRHTYLKAQNPFQGLGPSKMFPCVLGIVFI